MQKDLKDQDFSEHMNLEIMHTWHSNYTNACVLHKYILLTCARSKISRYQELAVQKCLAQIPCIMDELSNFLVKGEPPMG